MSMLIDQIAELYNMERLSPLASVAETNMVSSAPPTSQFPHKL